MKCVCVDNSCELGVVPVHLRPVVGETYTIAELWHDDDGGLYLILAELRPDVGSLVDGFRPLVTRTQEQDVALFRQILAQTPAEVDA